MLNGYFVIWKISTICYDLKKKNTNTNKERCLFICFDGLFWAAAHWNRFGVCLFDYLNVK